MTENTKSLVVALSDEQIKALKEGKVIEALDGKTKVALINGKPCKVLASTSSKPRFSMFYVPHRSTPLACQISEEDLKKAIIAYVEAQDKAQAYVECYKRNGSKDEQGNILPLAEQIKNGTARIVRFRVTKDINEALITEGVRQIYVDDNGEPWYVANDILETTDGLTASAWKVDESVNLTITRVQAVEF